MTNPSSDLIAAINARVGLSAQLLSQQTNRSNLIGFSTNPAYTAAHQQSYLVQIPLIDRHIKVLEEALAQLTPTAGGGSASGGEADLTDAQWVMIDTLEGGKVVTRSILSNGYSAVKPAPDVAVGTCACAAS